MTSIKSENGCEGFVSFEECEVDCENKCQEYHARKQDCGFDFSESSYTGGRNYYMENSLRTIYKGGFNL